MDKDIRHGKYRLIILLPDRHLDHRPVCLSYHSVKRKGYGHILILLDAAVVMCVEISHPAILIQRVLLEIKTGAVYMSTQDVHSVLKGFVSQIKESHGLSHADRVHLVSML